MLDRQGMTLMEIIVVLVIIAIAAVFFLPDFTTPTEKARASTVQTNLLAIYSAQQNYRNNSGAYCYATSANPCDNLADINTNLSLNIQDDGTYAYACSSAASTCTATRTNIAANNTIVLTLNLPVNVSGTGAVNPQCNLTAGWCP